MKTIKIAILSIGLISTVAFASTESYQCKLYYDSDLYQNGVFRNSRNGEVLTNSTVFYESNFSSDIETFKANVNIGGDYLTYALSLNLKDHVLDVKLSKGSDYEEFRGMLVSELLEEKQGRDLRFPQVVEVKFSDEIGYNKEVQFLIEKIAEAEKNEKKIYRKKLKDLQKKGFILIEEKIKRIYVKCNNQDVTSVLN